MADAWQLHLCSTADMREYIALAELDQSELYVVAVGRVILQTVAACAEQAEGFKEVGFILRLLVPASKFY